MDGGYFGKKKCTRGETRTRDLLRVKQTYASSWLPEQHDQLDHPSTSMRATDVRPRSRELASKNNRYLNLTSEKPVPWCICYVSNLVYVNFFL